MRDVILLDIVFHKNLLGNAYIYINDVYYFFIKSDNEKDFLNKKSIIIKFIAKNYASVFVLRDKEKKDYSTISFALMGDTKAMIERLLMFTSNYQAITNVDDSTEIEEFISENEFNKCIIANPNHEIIQLISKSGRFIENEKNFLSTSFYFSAILIKKLKEKLYKTFKTKSLC